MKPFNTLALIAVASLLTLNSTAFAGQGSFKQKLHDKAQHTRQGFTRDVTETGPNGTKTLHTAQTPTENGFTRNAIATNAKGQTATRDVNGAYDPTTKTWTKTAERTNFDGSTASSSHVTTKTDTGYTRESDMTNRKGVTTTRSVDATYNKDTHSFDKEVSLTKTKPTESTGE